jgi:hypothetical protein
VQFTLTFGKKCALSPQMSNAIADLDLSFGVRYKVGEKLREKCTAKELSVETLAQSPEPAAQKVTAALNATKTSAAATVLFYFLTAITLGIYLLWTLSIVRYITLDRGSFYNAALAALEDLANPPPEPEPTPPADEISQLEAAEEEEEVKNPLKIICERIFEGFTANQFSNTWEKVKLTSAYKIFKKSLNLKKISASASISAAYQATLSNWKIGGLPALLTALKITEDRGDALKFRKGITEGEWKLFINRPPEKVARGYSIQNQRRLRTDFILLD